MSQAFKLFRLQQVDSQIDHSRGRIREIESLIAEDGDLKTAEDQTIISEAKLLEVKKDLKKAEQATETQKNKIRLNQDELFSGRIRNPKVLQDLQNEGEALTRFLGVLEERQLELMLSFEEAETEHTKNLANLSRVKARRIELHAALKGELSQLEISIIQLKNERTIACENIAGEDLQIYEKLRATKRGVAVAKVTDQSCSACGSTLNSALLQSARSPSQLVKCDTCGRILYAV